MASLLFETSFGQGSTNETPTWLDGLLFRYHLIQDLPMIGLNIKWTVQAIPAIDRCTFPIISTLPGLPLRAGDVSAHDVHRYYIIISCCVIPHHCVPRCMVYQLWSGGVTAWFRQLFLDRGHGGAGILRCVIIGSSMEGATGESAPPFLQGPREIVWDCGWKLFWDHQVLLHRRNMKEPGG
jgi:hypothetical protein